MSSCFDLETALAAWRRSLEYNRAFDAADLDELERHLRDQIEALARQGVPQEEAFHRALGEMGSYGAVEAEYRKVYWGKRRRRRQLTSELSWRLSMLKNYLKIALRNLLRHKGYAFINISGLAVGMACCVLISFFVRHELSYDRFHRQAHRIYRVATDSKLNDAPYAYYASSGKPVGAVLRSEFPEVERVARIFGSDAKVKHEGQYVLEQGFFAEPDLFHVFSFPLLQGDPATALNAPGTVVLTTQMALRHFGRTRVVGETIALNDEAPFTVTGVLADIPDASHFTFDFLASFATLEQQWKDSPWDWDNYYFHTYVLLREGVSAEAFQKKILHLSARHFEEHAKAGRDVRLVLQPLTDIHLRSGRQAELGVNGDARYVYLFGVVAVFVLVIACINFVNLSTARSLERAREVGVRKAVGSSRRWLVGQFLAESFLVALCALPVATGLVALGLPLLNRLSGKVLPPADLLSPALLPLAIGLAAVVGLLAGSYPALVLSRFAPADILRGVYKSSRRGIRLRQTLVVFQFALSVMLIAGSLVVHDQLRYMQTRDLGFNQEQILVTHVPDPEAAGGLAALKQHLHRLPAVQQVTVSSRVPGGSVGTWVVSPEGAATAEPRNADVIFADEDFAPTMGLRFAAGRNFSPTLATDAEAVLLNETAVAHLGWNSAAEALGKTINMSGIGKRLTVIGVVRDYHQESLQRTIEPLLIAPQRWPNNLAIRLTPGDVQDAVGQVAAAWKRLFPEYPFDYFFLDDHFDAQYRTEQRLAGTLGVFAGLAVLIACLGLFGLASFTAAQRTKEIGVRKVLGASVGSIVTLLSKDFLGLVGIAFIIAVPVAWFAMSRWLENFAFRTALHPWVFAAAIGLTALIAVATVSYQAAKAALADPVKSLRYE